MGLMGGREAILSTKQAFLKDTFEASLLAQLLGVELVARLQT